MSYYGIVFPEFWTGDTGRAIRELGGRDAQLLALYLMSAPATTMIGIFRLRAEDVRRDLDLSPRALRQALAVLADPAAAFAEYDEPTEHVWVRQMAWFRLGLHRVPNGRLKADDNRAIGARRLYESLAPNPFLAPFFDRYHQALHLKTRRMFSEKALGRGLEGASKGLSTARGSEGASKGLERAFEASTEISTDQGSEVGISTEQGSENRDQGSGKSTGAHTTARRSAHPHGTQPLPFAHYCRIAHEAFEKSETVDHNTDLTNVSEWFKVLCAQAHVPYDGEIVRKAIDAVDAARARAGSRRSA